VLTAGFEDLGFSVKTSEIEQASMLEIDRLLVAANYASTPSIPSEPLLLREQIRVSGPHFKAIRRDHPNGIGPLESTYPAVLAALTKRYETLKAALRAPAMVAKTLQLIHRTEPPENVIFGILRYRPPEADELVDTLILTFWRRHLGKGNFVLVAPRPVYTWIAVHIAGDTQHLSYGIPTDASPIEYSEDTEKLCETVAGLWDPESEFELSDFTEAMAAARRCLN
jgi:hypothetical protein